MDQGIGSSRAIGRLGLSGLGANSEGKTSDTDLSVLARWENVSGARAWVASGIALRGTAKETPFERVLLEAMRPEPREGVWKIARVHGPRPGTE